MSGRFNDCSAFWCSCVSTYCAPIARVLCMCLNKKLIADGVANFLMVYCAPGTRVATLQAHIVHGELWTSQGPRNARARTAGVDHFILGRNLMTTRGQCDISVNG